jgi:hypothetical protein
MRKSSEQKARVKKAEGGRQKAKVRSPEASAKGAICKSPGQRLGKFAVKIIER